MNCNENPRKRASRTPRFNLPVEAPSRWRLLIDGLVPSPMRTYRLRNLSARLFEETIDRIDERKCRE